MAAFHHCHAQFQLGCKIHFQTILQLVGNDGICECCRAARAVKDVGGSVQQRCTERGLNATSNHRELLAAFLALKNFCCVLTGQHVLIRTDDTTVVSYINKQMLPPLELACSLLTWCSVHFLSLRATHVPGCLYLETDLLSGGDYL